MLIISGADLMNGTPIYDIKPYIPYTDCINDAEGGFAEENNTYEIDVEIADNLLEIIPEEKRVTVSSKLMLILALSVVLAKAFVR